MKIKLHLLVYSLLGTLLLTSNINATYVLPVRVTSVDSILDPIVFDGMDYELSWGPEQSMSIFTENTPQPDSNDFSGYFRLCYDSLYLYFYAHIKDDTAYTFNPDPEEYGSWWLFDNIQVHLDLDTNSVDTYYGPTTIQINFDRGVDSVYPNTGHAEASDYIYHWQEVSGGWVVEMGIPWKAALPVGSQPGDIKNYINKHLGFDVQFVDVDDAETDVFSRDLSAWDRDTTKGSLYEDMAYLDRSAFGIIDLIHNYPYSQKTIIDTILCSGDSILAGGTYRKVAGNYADTLVDINTNDSIIITRLRLKETYTTTLNAVICGGDSYSSGGTNKTETGVYYDTLVAINGCDSVIVTNLTVNATYQDTLTVAICPGETYAIAGTVQSVAGYYSDTLVAVTGCDSITVTELTFSPVYNISIDTTICEGESYYAEGAYQTQAGTYTDSLITVSGCDSVIVTQLNVETCQTTGISGDVSESALSIYPVPSSDYLIIVCKEMTKVQLYDISGRLRLISTNAQLNLSAYPEGIYYLRVFTNDGHVFVRKFSHKP